MEIVKKEKCTGCGLCVATCKRSAISMKYHGVTGFVYPIVDDTLCEKCGLCIKACPANSPEKKQMAKEAYAIKLKDINNRMNSRSGGIFVAVSDYVLKKNGVVYGVGLSSDFKKALFKRAVTSEQRDEYRGSKYIQAELSQEIYCAISKDLIDGKLVCFSGCPCHVSAVKRYLHKQHIPDEKLITLDIICHGVPSPKVWSDMLDSVVGEDEKILKVDFRNKKRYGWGAHVESIFTNKRTIYSVTFRNLFYSHLILRENCFDCPYTGVERVGDITIGDFWGIDSVVEGFNDNKGVSLVLVNTEKGSCILADITEALDLVSIEVEQTKMQQPLISPLGELPSEYNRFWEEYKSNTFSYIRKKYGMAPIKLRIKWFVREIILITKQYLGVLR